MAIKIDDFPKYWSEKGKEKDLTYKDAKKFLNYLLTKHSGYVTVDTETESLGKKYNKLVSIQMSIDDKVGYVIALEEPYTKYEIKESNKLKILLKELFSSKDTHIVWVMHNAQFDCSQIMNQLKVAYIEKPIYDTQLLVHILDENRIKQGDYGKLKSLAKEFFGFNYEEEAIQARSDNQLMALKRKTFITYAGMDAYVTFRLFSYLRLYAVQKTYWRTAEKLCKYLLSGAIKMFTQVSSNGFYVDKHHLMKLISNESPIINRLGEIEQWYKNNPKIIAINKELYSNSNGGANTFGMGTPWIFDINKLKDRVALFFTSKNGYCFPKDENGKYSCGKFFQRNNSNNEAVKMFAEEQGLKKLKTSYLDPIWKILSSGNDCEDSRIRANFRMNATVTGRVSSANPNLQQIPRSDNFVKKQIKCLYAAQPSGDDDDPNVLLQADFCANEIRFWGAISNDPKLCEAFNTSFEKGIEFRKNPKDEKLEEEAHLMGDIHKQTASMMFGVDIHKVDKALRQASKSLSLGIMYQRGVKSIAGQIGCSEEEAQAKKDKFDKMFNGGVQWAEKMKALVLKQGYVESPLGRRRRLNDFINIGRGLEHKANEIGKYSLQGKKYMSDSRKYVSRAQRQAVNSPIQGLASDLALVACSLLTKYIIENKKGWKIVNSVHDSVVVELRSSEILDCAKMIRLIFTKKNREYVEKYFGWSMPCHIDVDFELSQGKAWKCTKCGNLVNYWKDKCDNKDKDGNVCGCNILKKYKLNHGYGTIVGWNETKQELKLIKKGF